MSKRHFRGSLSRNEPTPSKEMPRLRFDDFTYESRISGPNTPPTRPAPPRNRASWAFSLRSSSGSSSSSAAGSESSKSLNSASSAVSTGGALREPPISGIMKTMEFELSYEERAWPTHGGMKYGNDFSTFRPDAIEGMRRLLGDDLPHLPDGEHPSLSLNLDVDAWFPPSTTRHSAPPEANWKWPENNGEKKNSEDEEELYPAGMGSQGPTGNGQVGDS
ncbi:uncharacterized protein CTRU02_213819 [Colletotrichum truncatum]|uniref:Uncharacterized protein n=1 Tax=Colletotrichum truncatum TaxID=5467 RepID=A0ACC3YGS0_COLTU